MTLTSELNQKLGGNYHDGSPEHILGPDAAFLAPHAWLLTLWAPAEELLETAGLPIEAVADRAGFGTAAALREQFVRRRGGPPRDYRRAFRTA